MEAVEHHAGLARIVDRLGIDHGARVEPGHPPRLVGVLR